MASKITVPNYGLLTGLAEGANSFMNAYQTAKNINHQQQMQELLSGVTRDADGNMVYTPEKLQEMELNRGLLREKARVLTPEGQQEEIRLKLAQSGQEPEFDEAGRFIGAKYRPDYLEVQKEKAKSDPFGLKAASLENVRKPKEYEFTAGGFVKRMEGAEQKLNNLLSKTDFDPTSIGSQAQSTFLKGPLEAKKDPNLKSYEQIKRDFVSAVLRKESGAAISPKEFDEEDKKYFPQPGDTDEQLQQKVVSRKQAIENLKATAGRAYEAIPSVPVLDGEPGLIRSKKPEQSKKNPKDMTREEKIKFLKGGE